MTAVRHIVDSNLLSQIVELPKSFRSKQVEIIVMPVVQSKIKQQVTRSQLNALLDGSHTEAISGILTSDDDMALEDLRAERRAKYEYLD